MKTIKTTLAALLVIAGMLSITTPVKADPSPTPVPVSVQGSGDITLTANNVPVPVVEALREYVVSSGAFAFPPEQSGRPLKSISIFVNGDKANARIVLGPTPAPEPLE